MTSEFLPAVRPRPRITSQVVLGLMAIACGVIFTLDNLEIIDALYDALRDEHIAAAGLDVLPVEPPVEPIPSPPPSDFCNSTTPIMAVTTMR